MLVQQERNVLNESFNRELRDSLLLTITSSRLEKDLAESVEWLVSIPALRHRPISFSR